MSRWVMAEESTVGGSIEDSSVTFALSERLGAAHFDAIFKDGMALVERTASYLDGPGRNESKGLTPVITVLYATESMRLTARLLDIASWLLIRRALRDGEIGEAEARTRRLRLKLQPLGRPSHTKGFDDLPDTLRELIASSFAMLDRILELDRASAAPANVETAAISSAAAGNPVGAQVIRLRDALRRR